MKIIFFGAPGAGKGTQAEIVSEKLGIPTISTGAIIRSAIKEGTEMGLAAKEKIEAGGLVPDEVVIGIIKERLAEDDCKNGFILDGFPRTVPQAKALTEMGIAIDVVLDLEVEDAKIVERMSGRRVCLKCGASYHTVYKKPEKEGICNVCGEANPNVGNHVDNKVNATGAEGKDNQCDNCGMEVDETGDTEDVPVN